MANIKELYINGDKLSLGGEIPSDLSVNTLNVGTQSSSGSVAINGAQAALTMTGSSARLDVGQFTDFYQGYITLPGVQLSSNSNSQYGGGLILVNGKLLTDGESINLVDDTGDSWMKLKATGPNGPSITTAPDGPTQVLIDFFNVGIKSGSGDSDIASLKFDTGSWAGSLTLGDGNETATLTLADLKALLALIHNN